MCVRVRVRVWMCDGDGVCVVCGGGGGVWGEGSKGMHEIVAFAGHYPSALLAGA